MPWSRGQCWLFRLFNDGRSDFVHSLRHQLSCQEKFKGFKVTGCKRKESPTSMCHVAPVASPLPRRPLPLPSPPLHPALGVEIPIYGWRQSIPYHLAYSCFWLMGSTSRRPADKMRVVWYSFSSLPSGSVEVDCASLVKTQTPGRQPFLLLWQPLWVLFFLPLPIQSGVVIDPNYS